MLYGQLYRGFESLPLRQFYLTYNAPKGFEAERTLPVADERTGRSAAVSVGEPTQEPTGVGEVVGESLPLRQFFFSVLKKLDIRLPLSDKPCSFAPLAQLDRASDYGSEGREFESSAARHLN